MSEQGKGEKKKEEKSEEKSEETEESSQDLAFANAQVVRVMRDNLANDKMIKSEVKVAMNKFLEQVCADVSQRMNKYPYAMMDYRMFEEAVKPYRELEEINKEKKRIVSHLEALKMDADKLIRDIRKTLPQQEEYQM